MRTPKDKELLLYFIVTGRNKQANEIIDNLNSLDTIIQGLAPLHWAAQYGRLSVVKSLVRRGANINVKDKHGFTPLHIAVGENHPRIVRTLIKEGANLHARSKDDGGGQAIHKAAAYGRLEILKILIRSGAKADSRDAEGNTPLSFAISYKYRLIAAFLRKTLSAQSLC